ncbi:MAG TPA: hypothetical protein PLK35_02065 [Candidatus Moranbacteria bacterium]|nr:hypothetical protein [Candidatus Moranbacteria bacterium]
MPKSPEFYIQNPAEKWKPAPEQSSIELIGSLGENLKNKNLDEIKDILSDPQKIRSIVLDRREKGKGLISLRNSFDLLFGEKFGPEKNICSEDIDSQEVFKWLSEADLPEHILNEMMGVAYHLKDHGRFFRLLTVISENEKKLKDKTVFARAIHDLSTWEGTAAKNPQMAIEHNKSALSSARELNDKVLEGKILFGLTYNKDLKPKEKTEDYQKYVKHLEESGDEYDAARAMIEAANSYASITSIPGKGGVRRFLPDNIDKALVLANEALKRAEKLNYSNAILKSHQTLSNIYQAIGDKKSAENHQREANKIKRETGYRY